MKTTPLRLCFALTIIFSAASGFSKVHVPNNFSFVDSTGEVIEQEGFNTCMNKLDSPEQSVFLANYLSYRKIDKNDTVKILKEKTRICENSFSLTEYKVCFVSVRTNIEEALKDVNPEYKEKKMALHLCHGVIDANASISCFEKVKKYNIGFIRESTLCRGNVPYGQITTAQSCFVEKIERTDFSGSARENSKELDRIVIECSINQK